MAIQKYQDSFSDLGSSSFSTMLDRFFNDSLAARGRVSSFSPQVDAYETEKSYELEAALPGLKREDIRVDFHQGRLTITGERHFRQEQSQRRYHLVESSFGSFHRSFQLPDTVEASGIQARFEDGILHVSVPKDEKKTRRHQIEVRGGYNSASSTAQPLEQVSQHATHVPVQTADPDSGSQSAGSSPAPVDPAQEMRNRPHSSGVGS